MFDKSKKMSLSNRDNEKVKTITGPIGPTKRRPAFHTGTSASGRLRDIVNDKIRKKKNTYKYKNINYHEEIRILKIFHGEENETLRCMLFTTVLSSTTGREPFSNKAEDQHPYWALSYCWGDEEEPQNKIELYYDTGGRDPTHNLSPLNRSGIFYIRDNLAAALRQFRERYIDVNVWVDALCINQDNNIEKTAQVSRMAEIYGGAETVCVWLGAGIPQTQEIFNFLKSILNLHELDRLIKSEKERDKWFLVLDLMKNAWFSRRWVIQELALAKKAYVQWGREQIQWTNFADAIALLMTKHETILRILQQKPLQSLDTSQGVGTFEPRALGASTLVHATSNLFRKAEDGRIQQRLLSLEVLVSSWFLAFEAKDPRDTIYAVLSLAKDTYFPEHSLSPAPSWMNTRSSQTDAETPLSQPQESITGTPQQYEPVDTGSQLQGPWNDARISPDYQKSLTDVCADFMEFSIEKSQSLDILCRHWAPRPRKPTRKAQVSKGQRVKLMETMPTWIPSIEGHAYGGPRGILDGRKHGDSLVGDPERQNQQHYNASDGLRPRIKFGKFDKSQTPTNQPHPDPAPVTSPRSERSMIESSKFDGTLYVYGFKLGVIETRSGRVLDGVIPQEAFALGGWEQEDEHDETPDEVSDPLWRTLVADRGPDGRNAPSWYRRACLESLTRATPSGDLNVPEILRNENTPSTMEAFLDRVQRIVWNRRFIKIETQKANHFGLGPPKCDKGDLVCILFGCSVPVILRMSPKNEDKYTFVGECYVHGMMDGEAIPPQRPKYPYAQIKGFTIV